LNLIIGRVHKDIVTAAAQGGCATARRPVAQPLFMVLMTRLEVLQGYGLSLTVPVEHTFETLLGFHTHVDDLVHLQGQVASELSE
jgi:hypothetical protein